MKDPVTDLTIGDLFYKNGVSIQRISKKKFKEAIATTGEKDYSEINRDAETLNVLILVKENGGPLSVSSPAGLESCG